MFTLPYHSLTIHFSDIFVLIHYIVSICIIFLQVAVLWFVISKNKFRLSLKYIISMKEMVMKPTANEREQQKMNTCFLQGMYVVSVDFHVQVSKQEIYYCIRIYVSINIVQVNFLIWFKKNCILYIFYQISYGYKSDNDNWRDYYNKQLLQIYFHAFGWNLKKVIMLPEW